MKINWSRGFRRLSYGILIVVWLVVLTLAVVEGPASIGKAIPGLLIFSALFMLAWNGVAWVVRGFLPPANSEKTRSVEEYIAKKNQIEARREPAN